jgi:hypothetical protein
MTTEQAAETAKRISELWPTTTPTQIGEAIKGLLDNAYAYGEVKAALSSMYLNGLTFFAWGELRCRVIQAPPRPDPKVAIKPFREQEQRTRTAKQLREQSEQDALTFVRGLPPEQLIDERDLFLAEMGDMPFAVNTYLRMFDRGKLPASFVDRVYLRRTGKRVAV